MNLIGAPPFTPNQGANLSLSITQCPPTFAFAFSGSCINFKRKTLSYRIDNCSSNPNSFRLQCKKHRIWCLVTESVVEEKKTEEAFLVSRIRRLILLRHAKSSWGNPSVKGLEEDSTHMEMGLGAPRWELLDHDRPLSKHGRLAAAKIAGKLQELGWLPELILSSDAIRTQQTLQIMQEHVREFLNAEVHFIPSFYSVAAMDGQTAQHIQQAVCHYSRDDILTVMCMGHNRGWEEAASMFSGVPVELKTSNAAVLEVCGKSWEEAFVSAGFGGWKLIDVVKPD